MYVCMYTPICCRCIFVLVSELWGSAGIPLLFWSCANDIIQIDQVRLYAYLYVCMYVCIYVCMYVCMFGSNVFVHVCVYVCGYTGEKNIPFDVIDRQSRSHLVGFHNGLR